MQSNNMAMPMLSDERLDLEVEIESMQQRLQRRVDMVKAKPIRQMARNTVGCLPDNRNAFIVTGSSRVNLLDSLINKPDSYISSDDDEERMIDRSETDTRGLQKIKASEEPTFMEAPKVFQSGIVRTIKVKPAYYEMEDDEYEMQYCGTHVNLKEATTKNISSASQITYGRSQVRRVRMDSEAVQLMNSFHQGHNTKLGISKQAKQVEIKESKKINHSFDSTSSLEMSRISDENQIFEDSISFSRKGSYEASTPAVSNKRRSLTNHSTEESPCSVSSTTTTCKGRWDKVTINTKGSWLPDSDLCGKPDGISSSPSTGSWGVRKLTYRPANNYSSMHITLPSTFESIHSCSMNEGDSCDQLMFHQLRWKAKRLDERDQRFKATSTFYGAEPKYHFDGLYMNFGDYKVNANITEPKSKKRTKGKNMDDDVPFDEK